MTDKDSKIALWMFMMLIGSIVIMMVQAALVFSYDHEDAKDEAVPVDVVKDEVQTINVTTWMNQMNTTTGTNNTFDMFKEGDVFFLVGMVTAYNEDRIHIDGCDIDNSNVNAIPTGAYVKARIIIYVIEAHERYYVVDIQPISKDTVV
jgi:hypothetical protein